MEHSQIYVLTVTVECSCSARHASLVDPDKGRHALLLMGQSVLVYHAITRMPCSARATWHHSDRARPQPGASRKANPRTLLQTDIYRIHTVMDNNGRKSYHGLKSTVYKVVDIEIIL